jgi:hypothetical protein
VIKISKFKFLESKNPFYNFENTSKHFKNFKKLLLTQKHPKITLKSEN